MVPLHIRKMGKTTYKIAYFHQDGLITGSAISLRHFLSATDRSLFTPIVVMAKEGPARKLFEDLDIRVEVFHFDTFWTFPGPRCFSRGLLRQLRALLPNQQLKQFILQEIQPDLIHINDKASMNVGISLKNHGIPIVQHCRSSYISTACPVARFLSRSAIKKYANYIICISEDEEDGFEDIKNKSIIYNTVDPIVASQAIEARSETRNKLQIKPTDFLIGFAANVSEKKGAWDFLELCKQLYHYPNTKFVLLGKIEDFGKTHLGNNQYSNLSPRAWVQKFIEDNNLSDQLLVAGFRNDSLNIIAAMDLLIVPNKNGVLGRQPLEAQFVGTPVIARSGNSSSTNIIINNKTGYLVKNTQEMLSKTKDILMSKRSDELAENAIAHARSNFKPIINMQRIENIYLTLLNN